MTPEEKRLLERVAKGIEEIGTLLRKFGEHAEITGEQVRTFGEKAKEGKWPPYDN